MGCAGGQQRRQYLIAQEVPALFWDAVPIDQLEAWVRAHVPAEMSRNVDQGLQAARIQAEEKQRLVPATDALVSAAHRA